MEEACRMIMNSTTGQHNQISFADLLIGLAEGDQGFMLANSLKTWSGDESLGLLHGMR